MMLAIATMAGVVSVMTWLYLLLLRAGFWRVMHNCSTWNNCAKRGARHMGEDYFAGSVPQRERPAVAVVVPARNEAASIGQCVASLLQQDYGGRVHVFVVDDNSSDGTASVARQAATQLGRDEALTVIEGRPLPPGWTGKLWAVQQGVEAARAPAPGFLLFTDADVVHASGNLASLVAVAETGERDLASYMVRLRCASAAERLLIPAFVFFFFMLYPPRWTADARRATAGAAGGCMLIRPDALERAGGVAAVRGQVIDDCALARQVKHSGGRLWLGLTDSARSVREYRSFSEIGRMISRSAFSQLHHSGLMLALAVGAMTIVYLVPVALLFSGRVMPMALGAVAWALMTIVYSPTVRWYGLHPLWPLTLPLASIFYIGATVWSALMYWSGRGGEWKGRAQDPAH